MEAKSAKTPQEIAALVPKWATGEISLKEIKGYTDEELFAIARIGYFYLMQGKNVEARVLFEGLVAIDPRNDYYYRALGVIFQKMGDNERAVRQFGYAIELNASSPHSYVNRAETYLSLEQFDKAEADLQKALAQMTKENQQLSKKAWALYQVVLARKDEG